MLDKLKLLLNIPDDTQDELLQVLISLCKDEAYTYCNLPEYNTKLDGAVIQMVIERYNRIGSEGATQQSSSGVSMTYDSFYSEKVRWMLNKNRKVKMI